MEPAADMQILPPPSGLSRTATGLMGVAILVLSGVLIYLLGCLWPVRSGPPGSDWDPRLWLPGIGQLRIPNELRFLWLVAVSAALGSGVHVATSFASYVGNQKFSRSWLWWYILRPGVGVSMALIFYFVIRGGLLTTSSTGDVSPFGVTALGGLVGMFSKQAADKLQETFDTLFRTEPGHGDDVRGNKLTS